MSKSYTLYIEAYTPETIPMARLARYMQSLAVLFGYEQSVHFHKLMPGSTQLVTLIDHEQAPKVAENLNQLKRGEGLPEAAKAHVEIDRMLAEDNATGMLYEDDDFKAEVISFRGVNRQPPAVYGPFNQEGSLDGLLVSVSGADQTVHIQLQNGDIKYTGIETNRETARRLARNMYEPVRVHGTGRWFRDQNGDWLLKKFRVDNFDVLASDALDHAIGKLREIRGSEWTGMEDPIRALKKLRDRSGELH